MLNLLDNAYKYSTNERQIHVNCEAHQSMVRIAVCDHGIGIARPAVRRIFDRFYQVERRLNRPSEGCGLGLSIVQAIVYAHGGRVRVESELGKGSKFVVELPKALGGEAGSSC